MDVYEDAQEELDQAVRKQLATWFPDFAKDILTKWQFRRMYKIDNAQPGQYMGPFPANVHGGRISSIYRGRKLPANVFVCGDHMSTATLNGALESGVNAGMAAGQATATKARAKAMATT
jgi:phytoene dehydrogenase-like protein